MISIVIPALNEEGFLGKCLESLHKQDYQGEYEIIVVDNGSTDRTADIAKNHGAKVVPCFEKKSVFYARQVGANAARGSIIAQADADTIYPDGWLQRIAGLFDLYPETVAVAGRYIYGDPRYWSKIEYHIRSSINQLTCFLFGRPLVISGANFSFRRLTFIAGGGYEGITFAPDQYGLAERLSRLGKIRYDHNLYAITSSRTIQKPFIKVIKDFIVHIGKWLAYIVKSNVAVRKPLVQKSMIQPMAKTLALLVMAVFLIGAHGCFAPASQVFGQIHYESNRPDNAIALTFDNSPMEPYTSEILDILAAYNVKATFFVSGENVARYPEVAKRIVAEGHILGNHSYNHDALGAFIEYGNEDLVMAQEIIQDITGILPILYRPPYGIKTPWHLKGIEDMGMIPITWSTSLDEFEELSLQEEVEKITSKIESGEIIRLYNGNEADNEAENACYYMLEALPLFIEQLLEEGYKLITVPELLDIPAYIDQPAK